MTPNRTVSAIVIATLLGLVTASCSTTGRDIAAVATDLPPSMPSATLGIDSEIRRIAFGSCFVPQFEDHSIFERILEVEPDAFLFLGDNVYQSEEKGEPELVELKQAYGLLSEVDSFARLRSAVPVLPVWDDHDYGLNDAGADFRAKAESEALFEHVWAVAASDPRRSRDGVYFSRLVGPPGRRVQLIMLDTRFFRSPLKPTDERDARGKERFVADPDPTKTMLGDEQWAWLEAELERPAEVRVIASSIQVLADGHGWEGWHTLPRERTRLFDLIESTGASGVVLASGDHHLAAYYRAPAPAPYPVPELTSSTLNYPIDDEAMLAWIMNEPGPNRVGEEFGGANFATLDIDWSTATVNLNLHDAGGALVRTMAVSLAELQVPAD